MKQRLDLSVRGTTVPSSGTFDTRPRAVTRWVSDLRLARLDETAQRMWHALEESNCLAMPAAWRFHLLETFAPIAGHALDHLRRRYANQSLPLSAGAERAASQAADLLIEFMRGYRTLLAQLAPGKEQLPLWRRLWFRRPLNAGLHRLIHYGGELLTVYRHVHRDAPAGLWKRIHRSYHLAETYGVLGAALPLPGHEGSPISIADEYRRLLLLSLLPPDGLAVAQWSEVLNSLPVWVRQTRLVRPPLTRGPAVCHLVRLARDGGPLALSTVDEQALAGVDTRGLAIDNLRKALEVRARADADRSTQPTTLAPETLQFLLDNWCSERQRTEPRMMQDGRVEVIIGLAALHHLLGPQKAQPAPETSAAVPRGESALAPAPERNDPGDARPGAADVWQSAYIDPEKIRRPEPQKSPWLQPANVEKTYSSFTGRTLDRSGRGCRVRMERGAMQNVSGGMLVALRSDEEEPWEIGIIARLKTHGQEVEMGARILGAAPLPVTLHARSGRGLNTFPAVLGRNGEGRHLLMAPAMPAVREGELVVEIGEHRVPVKRIGKGTHSRHMATFMIQALREDDRRYLEQASATHPVAPAKAAAPQPETPRTEPAAANTPAKAKPQPPSDARVEQLMQATGMSREDAEFFLSAEAEHETDPSPRLKRPG